MTPNEFKAHMDDSLSALKWENEDRQRVLNALNKEDKKMKKVSVTVLLAAALVAFNAVAIAEGLFEQFFQNVFGTGVSGQPEYTEFLGDKAEYHPGMIRVDADQQLAKGLLGPYVWEADQTWTLEGYTVTLENAVMDENGIGALLIKVANPNGHGLKKNWADYTADEVVPVWFGAGSENAYMDDELYAVEDTFSDTEIEYAMYITPMHALSGDEKITLFCSVMSDNPAQETASAEIPLETSVRVPARVFEKEGILAKVSPLGMMLHFPSNPDQESTLQTLVIRYEDGSEYIVLNENQYNLSVMSGDPENGDTFLAFNRLVDPEHIAAISFQARSGDVITDAALKAAP